VKPGFGLGLLRRAVGMATLAALGAGDHDSAYTQDGPGPGHPVPTEPGSRWRPQISQAQSVELEVGTLRGAYPGRDGAQVLYRLGSDGATEDFRGWQDPVLVTGWSAPSDGWGSGSPWTTFAATVIPATGLVIVVALDDVTGDAQTWSWDPRTDAWTTLYDWDAGALDGLVRPIGLAYDAEGERLLLWSGYGADGSSRQIAYSSADGGATWRVHSRGFLDLLGAAASFLDTTGKYQVALGDDLDWLLMAPETNSGEVEAFQFCSSDGGVSWQNVALGFAGAGDLVRVPAGFVYAYANHFGDKSLYAQRVAAASASLGSGLTSDTLIDDSRDYLDAWAACDDDGTLYVLARGDSGGATIGQLYLFRSTDGGVTWESYGWGVWATGSASHYFEPSILLASQGRLHLVGTAAGSGGAAGTVQIVSLGGWSQVAHGAGSTDYARTSLHRFGYGVADADATDTGSAAYLPVALPGFLGWTAVTGTGTATLTATTPGLHLVTTAGQGQTFAKVGSNSALYAAGEFEYQLDATGNVTLATLGTSGGGVFFSAALIKAGGGGYTYAPVIDVGSDGLQLRDGSTIRESVSFDTTARPFACRLHVTKGQASAWYSTDGGVVWHLWADGVTVTDGGPAVSGADTCFWGVDTGHIGRVTVRRVGFVPSGDWQSDVQTISTATSAPRLGPPFHQFGRAVGGRGTGYPIPEGAAAGGSLPLLSATGGPTHTGELVSLPVAYTHPISAIDPMVSPSPRRTWRATDDSKVQLVWDLGEDQQTWLGGAVGLLVIGAPRLWLLERSNGAGGFETLGTLDLAWGSSLTWTRIGRMVVPRTGTSTISQRIAKDALKGGYFDLDGVARRITRNSAGFWTSSSAEQQVRIELEGIDGSEPDDGTAGVLVAPGGVLVAYPSADTPRRYLRVTAAAGQVVPGDIYQAGAVVPFGIVGMDDPDWTWSSTTQLSRSYTEASDGVATAAELGPPRRILTYGWSSVGAPLFGLRTLVASPETIAAAGGVPIGTVHNQVDLPQFVAELESGALPVVVLPRLPPTTSTITDPSLWLLGTVSSPSIELGGQGGTEGRNELVTASGLTVSELR
jgi:hypothetical protein